MAKKRDQQPFRLRRGEAVVIDTGGGMAIVASVVVKRRVHIFPVNGATIRRLKPEADDRRNQDCSGK